MEPVRRQEEAEAEQRGRGPWWASRDREDGTASWARGSSPGSIWPTSAVASTTPSFSPNHVWRPIPTRCQVDADLSTPRRPTPADNAVVGMLPQREDEGDSAFEDADSVCSRTTPVNHKSIRKWRQRSLPSNSASLALTQPISVRTTGFSSSQLNSGSVAAAEMGTSRPSYLSSSAMTVSSSDEWHTASPPGPLSAPGVLCYSGLISQASADSSILTSTSTSSSLSRLPVTSAAESSPVANVMQPLSVGIGGFTSTPKLGDGSSPLHDSGLGRSQSMTPLSWTSAPLTPLTPPPPPPQKTPNTPANCPGASARSANHYEGPPLLQTVDPTGQFLSPIMSPMPFPYPAWANHQLSAHHHHHLLMYPNYVRQNPAVISSETSLLSPHYIWNSNAAVAAAAAAANVFNPLVYNSVQFEQHQFLMSGSGSSSGSDSRNISSWADWSATSSAVASASTNGQAAAIDAVASLPTAPSTSKVSTKIVRSASKKVEPRQNVKIDVLASSTVSSPSEHMALSSSSMEGPSVKLEPITSVKEEHILHDNCYDAISTTETKREEVNGPSVLCNAGDALETSPKLQREVEPAASIGRVLTSASSNGTLVRNEATQGNCRRLDNNSPPTQYCHSEEKVNATRLDDQHASNVAPIGVQNTLDFFNKATAAGKPIKSEEKIDRKRRGQWKNDMLHDVGEVQLQQKKKCHQLYFLEGLKTKRSCSPFAGSSKVDVDGKGEGNDAVDDDGNADTDSFIVDQVSTESKRRKQQINQALLGLKPSLDCCKKNKKKSPDALIRWEVKKTTPTTPSASMGSVTKLPVNCPSSRGKTGMTFDKLFKISPQLPTATATASKTSSHVVSDVAAAAAAAAAAALTPAAAFSASVSRELAEMASSVPEVISHVPETADSALVCEESHVRSIKKTKPEASKMSKKPFCSKAKLIQTELVTCPDAMKDLPKLKQQRKQRVRSRSHCHQSRRQRRLNSEGATVTRGEDAADKISSNKSKIKGDRAPSPVEEKKNKTRKRKKRKKNKSTILQHQECIEDLESSCRMNPRDLISGRKVILREEEHFYCGILQEISPPDVYGVLLEHRRGKRPQIFSREEILQKVFLELVPPTVSSIPPGTRVCAFWSQTFHHMFPGRVGDPKLVDERLAAKNHVNIELDDGDSRDIPVNHVRLLPQDYPLVEQSPNLVMNPGKRKLKLVSTSSSIRTGAANVFSSSNSSNASVVASPCFGPVVLPASHASLRNKRSLKLTLSTAKKGGESEEKEQSSTDGDDNFPDEAGTCVGSGIAAFLPKNSLWRWLDKGRRARGRVVHKAIVRGGGGGSVCGGGEEERLKQGECAVFLSTGKPDRPYVGRLESLWETLSGQRRVKVKWFYHAMETEGSDRQGRHRVQDMELQGALFEARHEDENDLQTIAHRCEVVSLDCYKEKILKDRSLLTKVYENKDLFYLAGEYDPVTGTVDFEDDIFQS